MVRAKRNEGCGKLGKHVDMKPVGFDSYTILGLVIYCVDGFGCCKFDFCCGPFL